jgi:hypothetical protein
MSAYLLVLLAIVSRVAPHPAWMNFTAVGGSLLYFGARRPAWQIAVPAALFAGSDYYLTVHVYNYPFVVQGYLLTWLWYAGAGLLGAWRLKGRPGAGRVIGASLLASTSFFAMSNFSVWAGSSMYPHTAAGLAACYAAGLPFYRNDILSTLVVAGLAFGSAQLAPRLVEARKGTLAQLRFR